MSSDGEQPADDDLREQYDANGEFTGNLSDADDHNTWRRVRDSLTSYLGQQYGGDRSLYDVLGYEGDPTPNQYRAKYERQDIARTIVNAPAATAWRVSPEIDDSTENDDETEFERDVAELLDALRMLHYWERADKVSGIGRFGVLVLGFNEEEQEMNEPVDESAIVGETPSEKLNYITPFSESRVRVNIEEDPTEERYGLPKSYSIKFDSGNSAVEQDVHWTRVIHIAEGLLENEVYGTPRLKAVYNRLDDLEKVVGGSAEMLWRGADRKFVVNAQESGRITDTDEMKEQVENMIHGLETVAYLRNMEVETISGEEVDPTGVVETLMKLIAGETGIPQRILTGSERGDLASTQDRASWLGRVAERQEQFCEPKIIRPTLDRLMEYGVISPPSAEGYDITWPSLFELSETEEAEVMSTKATALKNASPMGDTGQLATVEEIRSVVFGWEEERGSEAELNLEEEAEPVDEDEEARDLLEDIMGREPEGEPENPLAADGGAEQV